MDISYKSIPENTQVAFIGGGNMATSIIGGLIKNGLKASNIRVSDLNVDQLQRLNQELEVTTFTDNHAACQEADVIILAVKPQILSSVCNDLTETITAGQLIISIAAGIDCSSLDHWLGSDTIVRCMPNTPALVGEGASGLFAYKNVSDSQKQLAEALLSAVGICTWVDEEHLIDAVTAVSGSGPAYFFLFIEAMIKTGTDLGLDKESAERLAIQTALGAGKLAKMSDVTVSELRKQVCSPNGTTEKAVESFIDSKLDSTVDLAMRACHKRAAELAQELGKN